MARSRRARGAADTVGVDDSDAAYGRLVAATEPPRTRPGRHQDHNAGHHST